MKSSPFDRSQIPHHSGVYIFKDSTGKILYVGKAIDLFSRVSSYFSDSQVNLKTIQLVNHLTRCETIIVESELEALILEANLIKKYLPPFNIRLADDKDYLYIKVTKEFYPKVVTARRKELIDDKKYFGPFPSASTVRATLKKLRRVFPWCSNPPSGTTAQTRFRPCFYYHLSLCPGPCAGKISHKDYLSIINRFLKFMQGRIDQLAKELTLDMEKAVKKLEFEQAASIKQVLIGLDYLTQPNRVQAYLENPNFLEEQRQLSLQALQKDLGLSTIPERIEAYDVSNIQGRQASGSMVVLTSGEIDKSQYRRFKIHPPTGGSGKPNDYAMISEVIRRRLKHSEWLTPDLILADGGKGQVRAVAEQLQKAGLEIPLFGLAKRMEWLYSYTGEVIKLPKSSLSLQVLQKIRDEAHRFAIDYHRKLRNRHFLNGTI